MYNSTATPAQAQVTQSLTGTIRTLRADIKEAQADLKKALADLDNGFLPGRSIGASVRLLGHTAQDIESGVTRLHALVQAAGMLGLDNGDIRDILGTPL